MKKVAILYTDYTPTIDAIKYQLDGAEVHSYTTADDLSDYDLVILSDYKGDFSGNALACHHSLLPAFPGKEPVKEAILNGVKVTGITVYYTQTKQIVAQYPVFIYNDAHYDELKTELKYLEQTIMPLVAEKILNNEPFEIRALLNKTQFGCAANPNGGCSGCRH